MSIIDTTDGIPVEVLSTPGQQTIAYQFEATQTVATLGALSFQVRLTDALGQQVLLGPFSIPVVARPNVIRFTTGTPGANPASVLAAASFTLEAEILDESGQGLSAQTIEWTVTSGPSAGASLGVSVTGTSGAGDITTAGFPQVGVYVVSASVGSDPAITASKSVEVLAGDIDRLVLTFAEEVEAGASGTLTLRAVDNAGNTVPAEQEAAASFRFTDPGFAFAFSNAVTVTQVFDANCNCDVEQGEIALTQGIAIVAFAAPTAVGSYPVTIVDSVNDVVLDDQIATSFAIDVVAGAATALTLEIAQVVDIDPGRDGVLEVGESAIVLAKLVDAFGNPASGPSGPGTGEAAQADVSLNGDASVAEGQPTTVAFDAAGEAVFEVTDDTQETVLARLVNVADDALTPVDGFDDSASISLVFETRPPAVASAEFASVVDNTSPPITVQFTEAVVENGAGDALAVLQDGAAVPGVFLLGESQGEFIFASSVPLDTCVTVDTGASNLVAVLTSVPLLDQQLEVCSPQVTIEPLADAYLLEGETRQLSVNVAATVPVATISAGTASFDGLGLVAYDWQTNTLTAPQFSSLFAEDGRAVQLALSGTADGEPLRVANTVTVQALFIGGDADADGLANEVESQLGLSPISADTDGDTVPDGAEDADGDGATNADELNVLGTDPLNPDSDDDGLADGAEVLIGANPLVADTDGDGLIDGAEVASGSSPTDDTSFAVATLITGLRVEPETAEFILVNGQPATVQLEVIATIEFEGRTLEVDVANEGYGTSYTSTDETVAIHVADGELSALSGGTATVTATIDGFDASTTLSVFSCGDGITGGDEECDDGGILGGDGCSPTCTLELYSIGGTVSGLDAGEFVELSLNQDQLLLLNANGEFTFGTSVPFGTPYEVGFVSILADKDCAIENATGAVPAGSTVDVLVTCSPRACQGTECIRPKLVTNGGHGMLFGPNRRGDVLGPTEHGECGVAGRHTGRSLVRYCASPRSRVCAGWWRASHVLGRKRQCDPLGAIGGAVVDRGDK